MNRARFVLVLGIYVLNEMKVETSIYTRGGVFPRLLLRRIAREFGNEMGKESILQHLDSICSSKKKKDCSAQINI